MDVTEEGYIAVATGCRQLQTLRMYACAHVNNAVLQACGELLPGLRVLDICGAHMVTDDGAKVSQSSAFAYLSGIGEARDMCKPWDICKAWDACKGNLNMSIVMLVPWKLGSKCSTFDLEHCVGVQYQDPAVQSHQQPVCRSFQNMVCIGKGCMFVGQSQLARHK